MHRSCIGKSAKGKEYYAARRPRRESQPGAEQLAAGHGRQHDPILESLPPPPVCTPPDAPQSAAYLSCKAASRSACSEMQRCIVASRCGFASDSALANA